MLLTFCFLYIFLSFDNPPNYLNVSLIQKFENELDKTWQITNLKEVYRYSEE